MLTMPARAELTSVVEQQLLIQLGERLRHARKARALSSVELAKQVGISRTTLRAVEQGDPSPTFGTYVRVLSALGLVGDLALLATGAPGAVPANGKPRGLELHGAQDLQSLLMHQEAVRLLREDPALVPRLEQTLARWKLRNDPRSQPLLEQWEDIVARRDWDAAVAQTDKGQQLRQASPLATILPEATRLDIIGKVQALKERARAAA